MKIKHKLRCRHQELLYSHDEGNEGGRAGHVFRQHLDGDSSFFTQNFYNCREELFSIDIFNTSSFIFSLNKNLLKFKLI